MLIFFLYNPYFTNTHKLHVCSLPFPRLPFHIVWQDCSACAATQNLNRMHCFALHLFCRPLHPSPIGSGDLVVCLVVAPPLGYSWIIPSHNDRKSLTFCSSQTMQRACKVSVQWCAHSTLGFLILKLLNKALSVYVGWRRRLGWRIVNKL